MTWIVLLQSCSRGLEPASSDIATLPAEQKEEEGGLGYGGGANAAPAAPAAEEAPRPSRAKSAPGGRMGRKDSEDRDEKKPDDSPTGGEAQAEAAPARAWFPESFLWQPLLEVPATGSVTVPVTVPDTLTTWRILALGQSAAGAQAGALTTFSSTLPAYVDVAVPTFLYAGDHLRLPIQAVNQQADALSAALDVMVTGGTGGGGGAVSIPAYGSRAQVVDLGAPRAGDLTVEARLGALDTVKRVIPVRPNGRPVDQVRGGTLAGPRSFALSAPPGGSDGSLVVTVFPGALGVAREELSSVDARGTSLADATYAYALAGLATPLVAEGALSADDLRATELHAWQRIAKATRNPDVDEATTALAGVRIAAADSLAGRLAVRLAESLRASQAADGTYTGASTLDATLVRTARAVWALGPDNQSNRLRATGAFERYRERLTSPYVAAWGLAANVVEAATAEKLRGTVRDALATRADGAKTLRVDARRPDGTRVSEAEATALAILALPADDPAVPDLAAGLLGLYKPGAGFGDGQTGILALRALEAVFHGDIPKEAAVAVTVDGVEVGRAVLDPTQPHAPVRVVAPGLTGVAEHTVAVTSSPAVPGLAFTAVSRVWVPWTQASPAGLDLAVAAPALTVGQRANVAVSVAAPAGLTVDVSVGLPAGVEVDGSGMASLVLNGKCRGWHGEDGRVTMTGVVVEGGAWSADLPVTATVAGELLADAARVYPSDDPDSAFVRVPQRWVVR